MNPAFQNLHRLEFVVTYACTGRCKHCSEGEHLSRGAYIHGGAAARAVLRLCGAYRIDSVMTFGGEPLLHIPEVCRIHAAARDGGVPARQLITNGFFSRKEETIRRAAAELARAGVNEVLLSVDAFHQETIPLGPVKAFARAAQAAGIPVRAHPAWLEGSGAENPYDRRTAEILREFADMGFSASEGNVVFPSGNALKYLSEYFDPGDTPANPYAEDPADIHALCIGPDGGLLGGNIGQTDILEILEGYLPGRA